MKRRIIPLILCTCLLLSGCAQDEISSPNSENVSETETNAAETAGAAQTEQAETSAPQPETAEAENGLTLSDVADERLENAYINYTRDILNTVIGGIDNLNETEFSRQNERELSVNIEPRVRTATRRSALTEEERDSLCKELEDSSYVSLASAAENSAYTFKAQNTCLFVDKVNDNYVDITLDVSDARVGYKVTSTSELRAFVRRTEDGTITFIPDPVYMRGLPVIANNPEHLIFEINGAEVMLDSFEVNCGKASDYPSGTFAGRGTDYIYAKVGFQVLTVNYDFETGYDCTSDLCSIEPIADDALAELNRTFTIEDLDKDPEMTAVYNAIMDNLDTFYKDSTHGIALLDLDFDGTPELLVSDAAEQDTKEYCKVGADVSIYRFENGGLKYIDTFPSAHIVVYSTFNSLGLKTLPDGTKGWFSTSYDDTDYVYQLKGDELTATEIFRKDITSETTNEYGYTNYEYDYYFMGELIVPTVIHEDISEEEGPASDTHLEWNGFYSYWGEMWELVGKIREGYCSDITETYYLYSDWLSPYSNRTFGNYELLDKYELTDRELSYNIAYLVDSYYLGEYNPSSYSYGYRFLGDYAKPVIYLYPEEETEVTVKIDLPEDGELTCTYPDYGEGWEVTALPDGTIYDKDGNEYYCLYWEGSGSALLEAGRGWCVAKEDSAAFLREKLLEIGLTAREANEFIIYWLPELQKSAYNVITLHTEDYAHGIPLTISPAPDSVIRVFMTFEPSEVPVEILPQTLPHYERNGFTLVEWGGSHAAAR